MRRELDKALSGLCLPLRGGPRNVEPLDCRFWEHFWVGYPLGGECERGCRLRLRRVICRWNGRRAAFSFHRFSFGSGTFTSRILLLVAVFRNDQMKTRDTESHALEEGSKGLPPERCARKDKKRHCEDKGSPREPVALPARSDGPRGARKARRSLQEENPEATEDGAEYQTNKREERKCVLHRRYGSIAHSIQTRPKCKEG